MADGGPVPAGLLARQVAWSLDATIVAAASLLLTKSAIAAGMASLHAAWIRLAQLVSARMAEMLGQVVDPAGLATRLLQDASLRAASASVETSLHALLLPPTLVFVALAACYWIGFERSAWQATPGKRALALQVIDLDGHRLGLAQAAVRHVAGALSWLTFNLGHVLAAVPPQKRALHDYLAGTRVVHAGMEHGDGEPRLPGWAKAWIALQLVATVVATAWLVLQSTAVMRATMGMPDV